MGFENKNNFEVIKGGKDKFPPESTDYSRLEIEEAEIKEEEVFSKAMIVDIIEKIAEKEGFNKNDLEMLSEAYDKEGNLICLEIEVKSGRAKGSGWKKIIFNYIIKGDFGDYGQPDYTNIVRIYYSAQSKTKDPAAVGIVAKYKNNKWELSPNKISFNSKLKK